MKPVLPEGIPVWRDEVVELSECSLTVTTPADPDALLEQPQVLEESAQTNYVPYWAYLWPAARQFASLIGALNQFPAESVLELGCGSGLAGLAALSHGVHVTFSDCRQDAIQLAHYNAVQNGFQNHSTRLLDWFEPENQQQYPWVMAADILYESRFHQPLLQTLKQVTEPGGEIWIADPGRALVIEFIRLLQQNNWEFVVCNHEMQQQTVPAIGQFQLLVITAPA